MNRLNNGLIVPDTDIVAADAAGLLSGVSLGSVVKVMMALRALHDVAGIDYEDLLNVEALPTGAPDKQRAEATDDFVMKMVGKPAMRAYTSELRLKRFAVASQL